MFKLNSNVNEVVSETMKKLDPLYLSDRKQEIRSIIAVACTKVQADTMKQMIGYLAEDEKKNYYSMGA